VLSNSRIVRAIIVFEAVLALIALGLTFGRKDTPLPRPIAAALPEPTRLRAAGPSIDPSSIALALGVSRDIAPVEAKPLAQPARSSAADRLKKGESFRIVGSSEADGVTTYYLKGVLSGRFVTASTAAGSAFTMLPGYETMTDDEYQYPIEKGTP